MNHAYEHSQQTDPAPGVPDPGVSGGGLLGLSRQRYVALAIYIVACLTDLLDGYIARHYNQVSDFGKFADPLADKCLVMAACAGS